MRTTVDLDKDLFQEAAKVTGIEEKTKLIHQGLKALILEAARKRLVRLQGTIHDAKAPLRRKTA